MSALRALLTQCAAGLLLYLLLRGGLLAGQPLLALAAMQGAAAAAIARLSGAEGWWLPLHLLFAPALVLASRLALPAWVYGAIFIAMLVVYWTTFRTRVPLFLSSQAAVRAVADWLPKKRGLQLLDVGSGTGRFVNALARLRPDVIVTGVETAPLPWLIGWLIGRSLPNTKHLRTDFWAHALDDYHTVYAFLSPVPMAELWAKCSRELPDGSWLISNSFAVPDVTPEQIIEVADRRGTRLYVYRVRRAPRDSELLAPKARVAGPDPSRAAHDRARRR